MELFGFSIGQVLQGAYRLVDTVGDGGTGVVYRAEQLARQQPVAIKAFVLSGLRTTAGHDAMVMDLERVSGLDHPNVVTVLDLNALDFDHPYVVMELLPGADLAATTAGTSRLGPRGVLKVIEQAAGALTAAHADGVIHGGLRPGNLILRRAGHGHDVRLTDFGIHHLQRTEVAGMDRPVIGAPPFMAPEQARGAADELGVTTDVWGLGAVTYFALCGRPPLTARYLTRFIDRVQREDPPPLSEHLPGCPEALDRALARSLAREPGARFPTVEAFVEELSAAVALVKHDPEKEKQRPLFQSPEAPPPRHQPPVEVLAEQAPEEPALRVTNVLGHPTAPAVAQAPARPETPAAPPDDDGGEQGPTTEFLDVEQLSADAPREPPAAPEVEDVARKTAELKPDTGLLRLRDVGGDGDEAPTTPFHKEPASHDWSEDFSRTLQDAVLVDGSHAADEVVLRDQGAAEDDEDGD